MGQLASQLTIIEDDKSEDSKEIKQSIFDTHTEELVIALCGPIGTDIHYVAENLNRILSNQYNYVCKKIKLSDLIRKYAPVIINETDSELQKKTKLIDGGNELRRKHQNSILAELAINEIAVKREELAKSEQQYSSNRICYIIDSLKNKEELDLFRLIYTDIFYFIGVYSSVDARVANLNNKGINMHEVYALIDRDSGEEVNFGQKVTDTFTEADFFLRVEENSKVDIQPKLTRFLNLVFSADVVTPSVHETAMYQAFAAAGNSACLSRQVGAAITDENGEIISVGWNDVPKAGGGVYKFNEHQQQKDRRCINYEDGKCFNDEEKAKITKALVNDLVKAKLITEKQILDAIKVVSTSRVKELIEFSRAVHAEMLAIILGSQKSGSQMIDGKLYCTTYPCHNCARHIVAAGIKEVYYIEPYRKSLAITLHRDSLTEDESKTGRVKILMFDGVAPRRYLDFFKMKVDSRKKNGKKINIQTKQASPKKTLSLQAIPYLEGMVTKDLQIKHLINGTN